jgi:hypothetical protein
MCCDSKSRMSEFSALGLYAAMDAQRVERGLTWRQVADELWEQSNTLNATRNDHAIGASTLTGIAKRGDCTCQHALFILRWLGRAPESFLVPPLADDNGAMLPVASPNQRLRWDLAALAEALDARRQERGLTWKALAKELRCSASQVQGLRAIRYAIGMRLAMRIVQWLERPAAAFIYGARW